MRLVRTASRALLVAALVGGPSIAPAVAGIVHSPRAPSAAGIRVRSLGWASSNWSGYAVTGTYTSVTGQWVVPSVSRTTKATYSSSWAGIDGFNDTALIQAGTEQDYYSGAAHYYAWWEILPAPETRITSLTVHPGDRISVNIHHVSGSTWSIALTDVTTGRSFSTSRSYGGPGTSAEWIEEAPSVGGRIATLAHYGRTTFDPGTVNGKDPALVAADGGAMVQHGVQVSTPSTPDSDTDGFTVAYGSSAPARPSS